MRKLKNISVILGLLLSFVTIAADNSIINDGGTVNLVGATYTARVTAPKAIVYADENMLSPLGYIANGKAIVVGNPRRMNRDLVPTVVYGRLAFVEIKDIRYENESDEENNVKRGAPREHNVDITIQRPDEKLSENNSVYLSLHSYNAGEDIQNAFTVIDQADKSTFTGFNLHFIHRQELSRVFWGAGIDYSSISSANLKFGYWMASPMIGFTPLRNKLFLIDLYASLDLGFNTELEAFQGAIDEPSGYLWGTQLNARAVLFPENKYHVTGAIGYRKYNISGFQTLKDYNDNTLPGFTGISSVSLAIGLGMEFN